MKQQHSLFVMIALIAMMMMMNGQVNGEKEIIRGVNLGGWMVLEPWILPEMFVKANEAVGYSGTGAFPIVDEWTWWDHVAKVPSLGDVIEQHWDTWVQQSHLHTLKQAGITHLRIPVGYWYFETNVSQSGEPFANGASRFPRALLNLQKVVNEWAGPLGLKVLIDLHAAPGSQNGFDNSGRRGGINILNGDNTTRWEAAVNAMSAWATQNLNKDALWGMEILNEPAGFYPWMWSAVKETINPKGYGEVRAHNNVSNVIFQTAFQPLTNQPDYSGPGFDNVWFDDHNYQAFGNDWNSLAWQSDGWSTHLTKTCAMGATYAAARQPTFVGEFSLAVTDCTIFLASGMNGGCNLQSDPTCQYCPTPDRMGHPETCDYYNVNWEELPPAYKTFLSQFVRAQMDAFEQGNGWIFWNFRTENQHAPAWDFLLGLDQGWIPDDVGNRQKFCQ